MSFFLIYKFFSLTKIIIYYLLLFSIYIHTYIYIYIYKTKYKINNASVNLHSIITTMYFYTIR